MKSFLITFSLVVSMVIANAQGHGPNELTCTEQAITLKLNIVKIFI
jgi:hypothetical protein